MRQDLRNLSVGGSQGRPPTPLAWLMLAPLLAWLAAFVVLPLVLVAAASFLRRGTLGGVVLEFTLESWAATADPVYLAIVLRSVAWAGVATAACLAIGYPAGYAIARARPGRRERLLFLVMIPFWTSFLVRTYAWLAILREDGLLNALLLQAGVILEPLRVLYTPGAVVLGLVHTFLPFVILPVYAAVERMDRSALEAALDLGASPWRAFVRVVLPMTRPGIDAAVLLVFVPALGLYAVSDILGGGRVDLIGNVIENQFKGTARNWPFGAALATTMVVAFASALWFASREERGLR